ncbi:MAG: transporter [Vicinamibacterales bacterium]
MAAAADEPKPNRAAANATKPGAATAEAQRPDVEPATISANRPGFGETADVVGRGVFQVESGMVFDGDRVEDATARTITAPAYLVRLGLTSRLEIQVASEGMFSRWHSGPEPSSRVSGLADVDLGFKAKLATEAEAGANVAVLGTLNLPTGADGFSSGGYDPGVKLAFGKSLAGGFSVGGNVQLASASTGEGRVLQHALSGVVARTFAGAWAAFGEAYRQSAGPGATATSVDAGVSRVVGANLQIDVSVGRGLTGPATDWFVAFGFAVRPSALLGW